MPRPAEKTVNVDDIVRWGAESIFGKPTPIQDLPLLDFVPKATPTYERPKHLAAIADVFERSERGPVRVLISAPPQHGKTQTIEHGLLRRMLRRQRSRNAYVSYQIKRGEKIGLETQWLAKRMALELEGTRGDWRLPNESSCIFTGIDGGLTGNPIDGILIIDDPHKDRAAAESSREREHVIDWYNSVAVTRMHPGASIVLVSTRWHPDDLYGTLAAMGGWEQICLPAINDEGAPLWPERRSLEFLNGQRDTVGEYEWASMWQGVPRTRGNAVFRDVHYYDSIPEGYRVGGGVDVAYTDKTSSDYCAAVMMASVVRGGGKPVYYVLNVIREHSSPPAFAARLRTLAAAYPGSWFLWYTSTTEKGLADLLREGDGKRVPIMAQIAKADKFVRAQPFAAAWNDGRVLLPRDAPWLSTFVGEVCSFTGTGDRHDDQVDAAAACFDLLARGAPGANGPAPRTFASKFGQLPINAPTAEELGPKATVPEGYKWG